MSDKKNDGSNNDKDLSPLERFAQDAIDALKTSDASAKNKLETYLNALSEDIKNLPIIEKPNLNKKELVFSNIQNFKKDDFIKIFKTIPFYQGNTDIYCTIHNFFEHLISSLELNDKFTKEVESEKFFITYVLFLSSIALLISQNNWETAKSHFIEEPYKTPDCTYDFWIFHQNENIIWDIRDIYWEKEAQNKTARYKRTIKYGGEEFSFSEKMVIAGIESQKLPKEQFLKEIFLSEISEADIAFADLVLYFNSKKLKKQNDRPPEFYSAFELAEKSKHIWSPEYFISSIVNKNKDIGNKIIEHYSILDMDLENIISIILEDNELKHFMNKNETDALEELLNKNHNLS
ncbi:hypothetical protein [Zymomonas mobilis]|uniref:hypothetical protein n=1 Tax=Zymomonas mobilis TaxID=542 RepID=UPI0021C3BD29|nr:hypothetical protein [Zymomonas mobilis]MCP9308673.1 hypothetical protein [Zymomonas mobilis]